MLQSKVCMKIWAVPQCVDPLPETLPAARELLQFGLELTNQEILHEINKDRSTDNRVRDPEKITLEDLNAYSSELLRCRHVMLFYKERLKLYEAILRCEKSTYVKDEYDRLRSNSIVYSATELAKEGRLSALTCLWPHIKTAMLRLAVLETIPETINPLEYKDLLATLSEEDITPVREKIEKDWCRKETFRSIWSSNWSEDPQPAGHAADLLMPAGDVIVWYMKRARQIEENSGIVSHAATLVRIASHSLGLPGLEHLLHEFQTLDTLVYDIDLPDVTLKQVQTSSPLEICQLLMKKKTPATFVSDLKSYVVPYLKRHEELTGRACVLGLADYLESVSEHDLSWILLLKSHVVPYLKRREELTGRACVLGLADYLESGSEHDLSWILLLKSHVVPYLKRREELTGRACVLGLADYLESGSEHDLAWILLLKSHVVPYLKRREELTGRACVLGLADYLESGSEHDLAWILLVLQSPTEFQLDVRTHLDIAERCMMAHKRSDQLDKLCDLLATILKETDGSISPVELLRRLNEMERLLSICRVVWWRGVDLPAGDLRNQQFNPEKCKLTLTRMARSLAKAKKVFCRVVWWRGVDLPAGDLRNQQFNPEKCKLTLTRMARSLAVGPLTDRKFPAKMKLRTGRDNKPTQQDWEKLLKDILDIQANCNVSKKVCYEIYGLALLTSGDAASIKLAANVLTCDANVLRRGNNRHKVKYETTVELIIKAAREYFNSASSLTDPALDLAKCCLMLIQDGNPQIQEELDLIDSLQILSSFNVPILPIQVRLCEDKMQLVEQCLSTDPNAYLASHKLLKLAKLLRIAGDDDQKRGRGADGGVHGGDGGGRGGRGGGGEAARRLAALRYPPAAAVLPAQAVHSQVHTHHVSLLAGEGGALRYPPAAAGTLDRNTRRDLFAAAVTFCDPKQIEDILRARISLELEALQEIGAAVKEQARLNDQWPSTDEEFADAITTPVIERKDLVTPSGDKKLPILDYLVDTWQSKFNTGDKSGPSEPTSKRVHCLSLYHTLYPQYDISPVNYRYSCFAVPDRTPAVASSLLQVSTIHSCLGDAEPHDPVMESQDQLFYCMCRGGELATIHSCLGAAEPHDPVMESQGTVATSQTSQLSYLCIAMQQSSYRCTVFQKCAEETLYSDTAYSVACLLRSTQDGELTRRTLETQNTDTAICAALYATLIKCNTPELRDNVYLTKPINMARNTVIHNNASTDQLKLIRACLDKLMVMVEVDRVKKFGYTINAAMFTADEDYRKQIVYRMARSANAEHIEFAFSLSQKYEIESIELWLQHAGTVIRDHSAIQQIVDLMPSNIDKQTAVERLETEIWDDLPGDEHNVLINYFTLLKSIDERAAVCGFTPAEHIKLLKKAKAASPDTKIWDDNYFTLLKSIDERAAFCGFTPAEHIKLLKKAKAASPACTIRLETEIWDVHNVLINYFTLLKSIDERAAVCGFTPAEHVKLLKKAKAASPELNYKLLLEQPSPEEFSAHILQIIKPENVGLLTKLLRTLPPAFKIPVPVNVLYTMWLTKYFFSVSPTSATNKKWMQQYRQCASYFNKLSKEDLLTFVSNTCFSDEACERVPAGTRNLMIMQAVDYCQQEQENDNIKINKNESSWAQVGQELTRWARFLENFHSDTIQAIIASNAPGHEVWTAIEKSHGSVPKARRPLCRLMMETTTRPGAFCTLIQCLHLDIQPDDVFTYAVEEYVDDLPAVQTLVSRVTNYFKEGVKLSEELLDKVMHTASVYGLPPHKQIGLLSLTQKNQIQDGDDMMKIVEFTLDLFKTEWADADFAKDLTDEDLLSDEGRREAFMKFLELSDSWQRKKALVDVLNCWPPTRNGGQSRSLHCDYIQTLLKNEDQKESLVLIKLLLRKPVLVEEELQWLSSNVQGDAVINLIWVIILSKCEHSLELIPTLAKQHKSALLNAEIEDDLVKDLLDSGLFIKLVSTPFYSSITNFILNRESSNGEPVNQYDVKWATTELLKANFVAEAGHLKLLAIGVPAPLRGFSQSSQHNENQTGLFYTMDKDLCKTLFSHGGFPRSFAKQTKTFTEAAVMVRRPALDVIDCIKASDLNKPAIRYLLSPKPKDRCDDEQSEEERVRYTCSSKPKRSAAKRSGASPHTAPIIIMSKPLVPKPKDRCDDEQSEEERFRCTCSSKPKRSAAKRSGASPHTAPIIIMSKPLVPKPKDRCDDEQSEEERVRCTCSSKPKRSAAKRSGASPHTAPIIIMSKPLVPKPKDRCDDEQSEEERVRCTCSSKPKRSAAKRSGASPHTAPIIIMSKPLVPKPKDRCDDEQSEEERVRCTCSSKPKRSAAKRSGASPHIAPIIIIMSKPLVPKPKDRCDDEQSEEERITDGENGTGKSLTMAHLLHYAFENGYLIIHVPWVSEWLRRLPRHKEMSNSATHEGMVDVPLDAAAWLFHFKTQNQAMLKSEELKISKDYVWSKRETTPAGSPLLALVEHGISRVKYACDVIDAIVKEVKLLSDSKVCKTFVAIDGFNCFFYPETRLYTSTKRTVKPEEVTLTHSFLELTKNDWTNGVIVLTADQLAIPEDHTESFLPKYLLYKKGFEHIDPFVPIPVGRYTEKEFLSCASYYRDRLWLRGPAEIDTELKLASAANPYKFMELCAPL
ncbi:unnamed protein product [Plutella xylostella]|uniref:(diamondback moth) hypothetical protein n=1 Tax=Plutella xylostella TaxID=51655 RepID=A0A8S4EQH3_PLUXY|nr:unnamed protein product [Plutella xylostella]